ncbi:MAG: PD40 domain-containing protein [Acidobacteria bacterium]|nr:PD40 domain-containing protein [Acidobacteriota bacterium]
MSHAAQQPLPAGEKESSGRLDSWKEIATYLKRDVRTVQRWEKSEKLPVHRLTHKKQGSVYAYKAALDSWWQQGENAPAETRESDQPADPARAHPDVESRPHATARRLVLVIAGSAVLAIAGILLIRDAWPAAAPRIEFVQHLTPDSFWKETLATDGLRIYYTEFIGGRMHLASTNANPEAGAPIEIPVAMAHPRVLAASTTGGRVLLIDSRSGDPQRLMVLNVSDQQLLKFSDVSASCASWSTKGDRVAACSGDAVVLITNAEPPEVLGRFHGMTESVAWSPDGNSLAVLVETPGPPAAGSRSTVPLSLWTIEAASRRTRRVRLPEGVGPDCGGSLAWVQNYLALASACPDLSGIWLLPQQRNWIRRPSDWLRLDTDFGRIVQVLNGRDGHLMAVEEQSGPAEVTKFDPRTGAFASLKLGENPVELDYSRDGRWITYVEYPERSLWRARVGGAERLRLTPPSLRVQLPHWSPDGKTVAFTAMSAGNPWQVFLVNADGGNLRTAVPGSFDQGSPTWSADSHTIIFGDITTSSPQQHSIRRFDLISGKLDNLPGSAEMRTARWSPDGRYIAAIHYPKWQLAIFDTLKQQWTDVAGGVFGDTLNWSHDSKAVYFDNPFDPNAGVFRYDIATRSVEPVLRYGAYRRSPDLSDVSGFSVAPDGSILFTGSAQSSRVHLIRLGK